MKKINNLKIREIASFLLLLGFLGINPPEAKSCIDPDTVITVHTDYSADFTEIAITLGNLKFMEEDPNVFCTCALSSYTDFFTNLEYVAFVETGTMTPYENMEPWTNTPAVDAAWQDGFSNYGNWSGFIAEVINNGLGPNDDVELVIRASTPPGYFVNVTEIDSIVGLSYLGTDAWDPVAEELFADHTGLRLLGSDNSSYTMTEESDDFFTLLDQGILASYSEPQNVLSFDLSPNPNNGSFLLKYNLENAASVDVNIRDVTGRLVYSMPTKQQSDGRQEVLVDVPKVALLNGLYIVEIISDRQQGYQKVVFTD